MSRYSEYIKSDAWRIKKEQKFARLKLEDVCCKVCKNPEGLHVHHKTYKRLGCEKLSDLVLLCGDCHRKVHKIVKSKRAGLSKSVRVLKHERTSTLFSL